MAGWIQYVGREIEYTVFAEINAHQNQWVFKGGSKQNRWVMMEDFSKGGVHKTDGSWWFLELFLLLLKIKRPGRLFWQIRYLTESAAVFLFLSFF